SLQTGQIARPRRAKGYSLKVNRRLPRLGNGGQRIPRARFFFDPLLFVADDVEQQVFILRAGQILFTMLLVAAIVERFAGLAVVLLACPFSDAAIKVNVGRVELLLAWLQGHVQPLRKE